MNFFKTLKAQHIALLITQPQKQIHWRMFGFLAVTVVVAGGILYGLFGDQIFVEVSNMFLDETGTPLPIRIEDAKWLFALVLVFDVLGELVWMTVVAFITMRVLRYLKTPLKFKHLFNIYLITRVYEMLAAFALLLGFTVVALYTGTDSLPLFQEEESVVGIVSAFIIPIYFFWVYIWSVRFVSRHTMTLSAIQKDDKQ